MIKRRFYRIEHADRDDAADSSSSSDSDSELDKQATTDESDSEQVEKVVEEENVEGDEIEDSSADEANVISPDDGEAGVVDEDDAEGGNARQLVVRNLLHSKHGANETESKTAVEKASLPSVFPDSVLQIKSVFRCRLCPRILCLSEETMKAHLNSKRHARSEKLLKANRLKSILNDDGEIENQETPAEMNARIVALAQDNPKTKSKRPRRKRKLSRKEEVPEGLIKKKAKKKP